MKRKPAVAGQFYPADSLELRNEIERNSPDIPDPEKIEAKGVLCPHAGYVFSGKVAGEVFARTAIPQVALILSPSHNYYDPPLALWGGSSWQTPFGDVKVHSELTNALSGINYVKEENRMHLPEHSGEVVLPFLQYHRPDIEIAAICVGGSASKIDILQTATQITDCLKNNSLDDALVVASSDMSHEQGPGAEDVVNENDTIAISEMQKLDSIGLLNVCGSKNITMCGALPAAIMMETVKLRGEGKAELVMRATSADSPHGRGDYVVGYAGMIFQ